MDEFRKVNRCVEKAMQSWWDMVGISIDASIRNTLESNEYKEMNKVFNEIVYGE